MDTKNNTRFSLLLLLITTIAFGQAKQKEVLTLGTFHFAFHNRDVKKNR